MKSTIQKKLASKITGKSPKKISLDNSKLDEIREAITRADVKALISDGSIKVSQDKGVSRARANKQKKQRAKGRQKGHGTRKGRANARLDKKEKWMNKIRIQRRFLKELKEKQKVTNEVYKELYKKAKGGFFRSKRHIKLYVTERGLIK